MAPIRQSAPRVRRPRPHVDRPTRRKDSRNARFTVAILAMMAAIFMAVLLWPSPDPLRLVGGEVSPQPVVTLKRPASRFSCEVAYVNDGDTFRCEDGTRVRLHAVAARESDETCSPGHPCPQASAASATATLRALVSGQRLSCEKTGTSYNRITAICWTPSDQEVNCAMVRSGTTVVWDRFSRQRAICAS